MKAKLKFKSKRRIVIASTIVIMSLIATIGGIAVVKNNNAAGAEQIKEGSEVLNNNDGTVSLGDQQSNDASTNLNTNTQTTTGNNAQTTIQDNNVIQNENTHQQTVAQNNNAIQNANAQQQTVVQNNNASQNANAQATNDATTTYQTVTENVVVESTWENHQLNWTPEKIEISGLNAVDVNKPQLNINKIAIIGNNINKNTMAKTGDIIHYFITV